MGFWGGYILGILTAVTAQLIVIVLTPTFAELGIKLHTRLRKKPFIKTMVLKELQILESVTPNLLLINQIPRFPDTPIEKIRDALLEINEKAIQLKSDDLEEIKAKLLEYAKKSEKLHANITLKDIINLLIKDEAALKFVEEIRQTISSLIKGKNKQN